MASQTVSTTHLARPSIRHVDLFYLFLVYIVWGSTYLAIRIAVRPGSGFPPFAMGALRGMLSGSCLLLWAVARRQRVRLDRREVGVLAASGLLLWLSGNGFVIWAEQRANSGQAALIIASTPLWVVACEALLDRQLPSLPLLASLVLGLAGIGLITSPSLGTSHTQMDVASNLALVVAALTWGLGSLLQRRRAAGISPFVSAGYQMLFGGLALSGAAWLSGERWPAPTGEAWAAWLYLVVLGSLVGFTSFVRTMQRLPTNVAMTYAYVNPVVAIILGWLILDERVTAWTLAGMVLVLVGLAGVFRYRR